MLDMEKSLWVQNRLRMGATRCSDSGNQLNFRCFVCGDSKGHILKKRAYFYKSTCSMYCFNCNTTLHGLKIVSELEKRPFKDVKLEYLQDKYGKNFRFKNDDPAHKEVLKPADLSKFTDKLPKDVFDYIRKRKIFEAPFLPDDYQFMFDENTSRLVIPWHMDDKAVYYQSRTLHKNVAPKYLFPKLPKPIFNIDMVDPGFPYIFLLEGAFDAVWVKNGVAIGGKNLTVHQRAILEKRWPKHQLVYCLDNHFLEPQLVTHILKLCEKEPASKYLLWPKKIKHIKDVNKFIMMGGRNAFASAVWLEKNILSSLKVKFMLSNL